MKANILTLAITLTVGIILAGSLLMPVISDATTTEETFRNDGVFNYGVFSTDDTYTLVYNSTTGISVNGTPITIEGVTPGTSSTRYSIIAMENAIVRYGSNADGYACQIFGTNTDNQYMTNSYDDLTATIADGKLSIVASSSGGATTTKTFEFTTMYAIVPSEDKAIMKIATGDVYIKGDSDLYASGQTTVTSWSNIFHFEGTYDDGITITSPAIPTATYENVKWNIEPVKGFIDLYKLTSIEFDIVYNDTTTHAVYSYFGVPSSVTAERSQHLSPGEIAIVNAIPILIIVALVMMAAGALYLKRDD